jgi:hypothetical protein
MLSHAREHDLDGVINNLTKVDADTGTIPGQAFGYCMDTTQPIPVSMPMELDIPYHHEGVGFDYCKLMFKKAGIFRHGWRI